MGVNGITVYPDTSDYLRIRDLDNLEFTVLSYSKSCPSI